MTNVINKAIYTLWDAKEGGVRMSEMQNLQNLQFQSHDMLAKSFEAANRPCEKK